MIERLRSHCEWLKSHTPPEVSTVLLYEALLLILETGQKIMTDVNDLKGQVAQILADEADLKTATAAGIAAVIAKLNVAQPDLGSIGVALGQIHNNLMADKQAVSDETDPILNPPTLTLDQSSVAVAVGASAPALVPTINPTSATVSYASQDTTIATVDASGVITGVAAGSTHVVATSSAGPVVGVAVAVS